MTASQAYSTSIANPSERLNLDVERAEWVNIIEEPLDEPCEMVDGSTGASVRMDFRCFEVKTLQLYLRSA